MAKVTIYTGIMCGFCERAKDFLKEKGIDFTEINIFTNPDKKNEMIKLSGGRQTVPQIFIGRSHVGGWDDLYELYSKGNLDELLLNEGRE